MRAAACPILNPCAVRGGQLRASLEADDDHVRFQRGLGGVKAQGGIRQMAELPPGALEVVVVEQLLRETIIELQRAVARLAVLIGHGEIKGKLWLPAFEARSLVQD